MLMPQLPPPQVGADARAMFRAVQARGAGYAISREEELATVKVQMHWGGGLGGGSIVVFFSRCVVVFIARWGCRWAACYCLLQPPAWPPEGGGQPATACYNLPACTCSALGVRSLMTGGSQTAVRTVWPPSAPPVA